MKHAVLLALFGWVASVAGAAETASDPAVQLPTYTVTDTPVLPPPEAWHYARIEGFEVLSNASARNTQDLVHHLQQFAIALDTVWPGGRQLPERPTALIICGRKSKFDEFVPDTATAMRGRVTFTLRSREHSALIVDYQQKVMDLMDTKSEVSPVEVDSYQQLAREYVRFGFGGERSPFPPWFVEGIAQIFMSMEITPTLITVGQLEDPNMKQLPGIDADWDRGFTGFLKERALMSMEELLTTPADSETARNPINSVWAKQSTAFVHWGLYGNGRRQQKAFLTFLQRLTREPPSEALMQECFKLNYREMLTELSSYLKFTAYKAQEFRAKKGERLPEPPPVEVRDATEAESARIRGDTLRLAGRDELARGVLLAAYIRRERDPQLLAALGLAELARDDTARARKFLEAAFPAKPVRPRAHLELARLRLADLKAPADAPLDVTQVGAVTASLLVARTQPPPLPEVYELLANVWVRAANPPAIDQLKIADEGVRRFPRDVPLIHDAAVLMLRAGRPADAAMIVRHGLTVARDEESRERLLQLQAKIPPAPAK